MTDVLADLRRRGLLPPATDAVPVRAPGPEPDADRRRDASRGALIGGAVGDALGRPAEGRSRERVRELYGELRDFQPWRGWQEGPVGTITDDTQLTVCVADWLLASGGGEPDPAALAEAIVAWLPEGRGKGQTCTEAALRLQEAIPWQWAGLASAGNGAAMRVAPVGLAYRGDLDRLRRVAALSAVVTHAHPMAVASAVAQAWLVARLVLTAPGTLEVSGLLRDLAGVLADVVDPGEPERKPDADDRPVRLVDRLVEVGDHLGDPPEEAFDHFYNGAFVLESLPAALWCFLRTPEDPEEVIVTAVNGGRDADTVAAMAGTLVGAYLGDEALPARWRGDDLEDGERLRDLADALFALAEGPAAPTTAAQD
ncbi:MAG: ADP-ribosylglycohydrolase family protein [Acidimicrobiales bacterium]